MRLSVVIPAHNEEGSVVQTVTGVVAALTRAGIAHEVIVVDDGSVDGTAAAVHAISEPCSNIRCMPSHYPRGFGYAVRTGLDVFSGDAVAIMMADGSDDPADLVRYHALLEEGYDCAFGSRFMRGSVIVGYPMLKLVINRIVNLGIRLLFRTASTTRPMRSRRIAVR